MLQAWRRNCKAGRGRLHLLTKIGDEAHVLIAVYLLSVENKEIINQS